MKFSTFVFAFASVAIVATQVNALPLYEIVDIDEPMESDALNDIEYSIVLDSTLSSGLYGSQ